MTVRGLEVLLLLALVSPAAGCDGELPSASFIDKLRVLAVRAEPPEAAPSALVQLDTLTVEPDRPTVAVSPPTALWLACREEPGATTTLPCGLRAGELGATLPTACADEVDGALCTLGGGLTASVRPGRGLLGADGGAANLLLTVVVADTERGAAACFLDTVGNAGLPTEPDRCVIAIKRLRVADPIEPTNQNPTLVDLQVLDEDRAVRPLLPGDAVVPPSAEGEPVLRAIRARRADTAAEQLPDGTYEALSLSWFTSGGRINGARSTFDPAGCETQADCASLAPPPTAETEWEVPTAAQAQAQAAEDGRLRIWAVIRDDRGGVGWVEGRVAVR